MTLDLDEALGTFAPPSADAVMEQPSRKCRHPRDRRITGSVIEAGETRRGWQCGSCGHIASASKIRAGRNARKRGKAVELREMRLAGVHTGNANKADDGQSVDGMFAYQSKAYATAKFPGWQALELDKLRVAHQGKVPVLTIVEKPGPGRKPRKLAVVEWQDWLDLHGTRDER